MQVRPLALAAAALAVGTCAAMDPAGWNPFGPAKWLAVSVLTLLALTVALWDDRFSLDRPTTWLWAALLASMAIAAIGGLDPLYAWTGTAERHLGVVGWTLIGGAFVAGQQLRREDGDMLAVGLVGASWVTTGYALVEAIWGEPIDLASTTDRLGGPFGSPALVGAGCALLVPATVGVALDPTVRTWVRRAAAAGAGGCSIALVGSGARAAWVGLAVAIVAWGVVQLRSRRFDRGRIGPVLAAIIVTVGVGAVVLGGRFDALAERDHGTSSRVDEWRLATQVIADHPVLGTGPEGYRLAVPGNVDAWYEQAYGRAVIPDRAHSGVLDVTATGGVFAGAVYLALLVVLGVVLVRALDRGGLHAGLAVAVGAYLLQQQLLFPLSELDPLAWMLAGAVVAWRPRPPVPAAPVPRTRRALGAIAAGLTAVALVTGVLEVAADRLDRRALVDIAHGRPSDAVAAARDAVHLRPDLVRSRLVLARAWLATGTLSGVDAALTEIDGALDLSPLDPLVQQERGVVLNRRAAITGDASDAAAALAYWQRLVAHDPVNARWQLELGRAAAAAGEVDLARSAWASAADLAPDDPTAAALLDALPAA